MSGRSHGLHHLETSAAGGRQAAGAVENRRPVGDRSATPNRRSRTVPARGHGLRSEGLAVVAALLVAGGAVAADPGPTGVTAIDVALVAALAFTVAMAGTRARRWTWLVLAGVAATTATGVPGVPLALAALALALVSAGVQRPPPVVGAVVAGAAFDALLVGSVLDTWVASAVAAAAVVPILWSGYRHARRVERRWARRMLAGVGLAVGVACLGGGVAAAGARPLVERGTDELRAALRTAASGDSEAAGQQLRTAARSFEAAHRRLGAWWARPARAVPIVGQNLAALEAATAEVAGLARAASRATTAVDLEALAPRAGRLDLAAVETVEGPLTEVATALDRAASRLADIESPWLLRPIARPVDRLRDEVAEAREQANLALDGVRVLPPLLGGDRPRRYLVLFTTPVESRGRYGFPGNYAEVVVDNGALSMSRFGRITELNAAIGPAAVAPAERTLDRPAEYVARYGRFDPARTWQNLTASAQLPDIAAAAAQLYPQAGGPPIDGLLVVDPWALAELMRDTGPVAVEGVPEPIGADNALDFLVRDQYLLFPDQSDATTVIEVLARTTFERLVTADLPAPRPLLDRFGPLVDAGHLAFAPADPSELEVIERLGLSGSLEPADGDALLVTNTNAGANKIDLFLQRSIAYDVRWDPTSGELRSTATVVLHNTAPAAGLPAVILGNAVGQTRPDGEDLPPGTNRTYLSVYTPLQLEQATLEGQPLDMESHGEGGRRVYGTFLTLPPGATATVQLSLSGHVGPGEPYRLVLDDSHLVEPDRVELTVGVEGSDAVTATGVPVNGREAGGTLVLDRDRHVTLHTETLDTTRFVSYPSG